MFSKDHISPSHLILLHLPNINNQPKWMKTLWPKIEWPIFSESFINKNPLLNMLHNMFVRILSKLFDLQRTRMEWIRNNSIGKKEFLTKKKISKPFSVALINSILLVFIITMKTLSISIMRRKREKDVILVISVM